MTGKRTDFVDGETGICYNAIYERFVKLFEKEVNTVSSGFKRALFGFKRKDVISYLEQIDVDHREEIDRAEKDSSAFEKRNDELSKQVAELTARCDELAAERGVLIGQKETALLEKAAIESDMAELVESNQVLEDKLYQCEADAEKTKAELCEKLDVAQKLNHELDEKISDYEKLIAEREVLYANAFRQAEEAVNAVSEKENALKTAQQRVKDLEVELEILKEKLETERNRKIKVQPDKKRRDAVSAILSYVRKR